MFALAVIVPLTVPDLELLSDSLSVTFGVKLISIVRLKVEETEKVSSLDKDSVRVNICVVVIEDDASCVSVVVTVSSLDMVGVGEKSTVLDKVTFGVILSDAVIVTSGLTVPVNEFEGSTEDV